MPIISFANSKGGVGKTTTVLALSQVFCQGGASVTLIDADPNQPLMQWANRAPNHVPEQLTIVPSVNEETIIEAIDEAAVRDPFVLVDLEGSANVATSYAIGRSDLVVIPMRGSQLDADQAGRIIALITREAKAYRRSIPFVVIYTCTSPVIRARDFRHIDTQLRAANIPVLPVEMTERSAFRTMVQMGGTLYDLTEADVSHPEAAIQNANAVAHALVATLTSGEETSNKGAIKEVASGVASKVTGGGL